MKFNHYISILLLVMLVITLTGCDLEEKDNKDGGKSYLFTKITVDKSETLDMEKGGYYYYLEDTGAVYVGYIINSDVITSSASFLTPVISENGNYYKYDKDKQTVEEIVK